jgi:hypothetical protein
MINTVEWKEERLHVAAVSMAPTTIEAALLSGQARIPSRAFVRKVFAAANRACREPT